MATSEPSTPTTSYDKVVNSSVLDAGLKQIADAIREKGGTTDSLAFPAGMADAIAGMGGGDIGWEDFVINGCMSGTFTLTSRDNSVDLYGFANKTPKIAIVYTNETVETIPEESLVKYPLKQLTWILNHPNPYADGSLLLSENGTFGSAVNVLFPDSKTSTSYKEYSTTPKGDMWLFGHTFGRYSVIVKDSLASDEIRLASYGLNTNSYYGYFAANVEYRWIIFYEEE